MAPDLNTLIASVSENVPQLERLSRQAGADLERVVNHGFRLGLVLIGVLLAGAVVAGLVYRVLAERLTPRRTDPSRMGRAITSSRPQGGRVHLRGG